MQRVSLFLAAGLVIGAVVAGPAAAQGGGGLYEPFPEPAPPESVRDFLLDLPGGGPRLSLRLRDRDLEQGVFVRAGRRSAKQTVRPAAASARAGRGATEGLLDGWAVVLGGALTAALGALLLARRRT